MLLRLQQTRTDHPWADGTMVMPAGMHKEWWVPVGVVREGVTLGGRRFFQFFGRTDEFVLSHDMQRLGIRKFNTQSDYVSSCWPSGGFGTRPHRLTPP